jgi:hypothetical protein
MSTDNSNDGVTRVSMSAEDTPTDILSETPEFQGRGIINGGVRINGDGTAEDVNQVHRMTTEALAPNMQSGIFGTLRNAGGFPVAYSQASDSCTVEVIPGNPASRTSLKVAEQLGYIVQTKSGEYIAPHETPQAAEQRIAETNAQQQAASVEKFQNADAENVYAHAQASVPESVWTAEMS